MGQSTKSMGLPFTTVNACQNSTNEEFVPVTGWMDPSSFEKIRATMEIRNICGDITVAVGYQLADIETTPDSTNPLSSFTGGAFKDSEGVHFPDQWDSGISSETGGNQLIRFGFVVVNATTTDLTSARVSAKIDVVIC